MSYDIALVLKVKDCVLVPFKYMRKLCFDEMFFRKAQDSSNPYFRDILNLFSEGQKISSVRDTSQGCCECPTIPNRPHLIVWYRTPSQTSVCRTFLTLIYITGVIKKGDLAFSMVCSGVLMIPSGFCLFLKVSALFDSIWPLSGYIFCMWQQGGCWRPHVNNL